jgi:hypothetical protein
VDPILNQAAGPITVLPFVFSNTESGCRLVAFGAMVGMVIGGHDFAQVVLI